MTSDAPTQPCRQCGTPVPPGARFCPDCGLATSATPEAAAPAPVPAATPARKRRLAPGCWAVLAVVIVVVLAVAAQGSPSRGGAGTPAAAAGRTASPTAEARPSEATATTAPRVAQAATAAPAAATAPTATRAPAPVLAPDEWPLVLSDSDRYKGRAVTITGRIFTNPERDADLLGFQIFTDPAKHDGNTMITTRDTSVKVERDQYVRVSGVVQGKFSGANAFGGSVSAPVVMAERIEVVDRATAVAPAYEVIELNQTIEQHGLAVTLVKVELARQETRAFFQVKNNSPHKASAYDNSAVIVQDGKQVKYVFLLGDDYPQVDSDLQPGTSSEGMIIFEPVNEHVHAFRLVWEGVRTDNYRLDFDDYVWEIAW